MAPKQRFKIHFGLANRQYAETVVSSRGGVATRLKLVGSVLLALVYVSFMKRHVFSRNA